MKRLLLSLTLLAFVCAPVDAQLRRRFRKLPTTRVFTTTCQGTENPLSETSSWTHGATTGLDWKDIQKSGGLCYGPANFLTSTYNDATAVVSGTWPANQTAEAVVLSTNQLTGSNYEEVELRLRTTITANSITGYEINWRANHDGSQYHQIGYWYGPIGVQGGCALGCAFDAVPNSTGAAGNGLDSSFDVVDTAAATIAWGTTKYGGVYDGDTVGASLIGNAFTTWIVHNGTKVILERFNDTGGAGSGAKFLTGGCGMGHWFHSASGAVTDFGFTRWTCSATSAP